MAHITRFIVSCLSSFAALVGAIAGAVDDFIASMRSFEWLAWISFAPDPRTSIDLDRAVLDLSTVDLPKMAARFKSWITRALTHRRYGGECFDLA